jgi:hypothetical protein
MTLWDNLGNTPLSVEPGDEIVLWAGEPALNQLGDFESEMATKLPGTAFEDIKTTTSGWDNFGATYLRSPGSAQYKLNAIRDIKFAEQIANRQEAVHIMYSNADGDNTPSDSYMTMAELGIVTSPTSMVTKIYRWDADTWNQNLDTPTIIWTNGQKQLALEMENLTDNPGASDDDATLSIFAGADAGGDAGGSNGGNDRGDNGSDAGCLSCIGIPNCPCL